MERIGLVPGSVPPFGEPIFPFELFADPSVLANERIAFNAGSLTDSIILASADWRRIAKPVVLRFEADTTIVDPSSIGSEEKNRVSSGGAQTAPPPNTASRRETG